MKENMRCDTAWDLTPLGNLTPLERAIFYEELEDEDAAENFSFSGGESDLFENPRLEVGIILSDGSIVPPNRYETSEFLAATTIDIYLERYFVQAMPGKKFDLQLAISARHYFEDRAEPERISHALVTRGITEDYVNYLSEPVFQNLKISNMLPLDISVTFLTDQTTERFTQILRSPELNRGIQLAGVYNPIFGTVANYVKGIVETLASAKKNQSITDMHLTFVSTPGEFSIPLIEGTYLLFQPKAKGDEDIMARKPRYDRNLQKVVLDDGLFKRNHAILRIAKH